MPSPDKCGPHSGLRRGGFTLIEIIVAMTIIAVITAVAVPAVKGLTEEAQLRQPLEDLASLVQEVRQRAMDENRPYEIILERGGMHALPGNRFFSRRDEFIKHLEELREPPPVTSYARTAPERGESGNGRQSRSPSPAAPAPDRAAARDPGKPVPSGAGPDHVSPESGGVSEPEPPWTRSLEFRGGMSCGILLWGDGEWETLEGDRLRRWVFQPDGMLSPARLRLVHAGMELSASFDPLTGEIISQSIRPVRSTTLRE